MTDDFKFNIDEEGNEDFQARLKQFMRMKIEEMDKEPVLDLAVEGLNHPLAAIVAFSYSTAFGMLRKEAEEAGADDEDIRMIDGLTLHVMRNMENVLVRYLAGETVTIGEKSHRMHKDNLGLVSLDRLVNHFLVKTRNINTPSQGGVQ